MGKREQKPKRREPPRNPQRKEENDAAPPPQQEPSKGLFTAQNVFFGCVGLALLLRLMNVLFTTTVPTVSVLLGDAERHVQWGQEIAAGNWYGDTTFYQAPLYPYFLAVLLKCNLGVMGIRLTQAVMGALGVAMLGMAAKKQFGEKVGIAAAGMMATFPAAIYYDGIIQKASLASFLLCGLLLMLSQLQQNWKPVPAVLAGLSLGLLVLTRENALLWIPVIGIWVWFANAKPSKQARAKTLAAYVAGLAMVLLPVAARNASLGGEWSPTTFQAGPNFYIGNNNQADGIYRPLVPGHETPFYERADAQKIAEAESGRELTAREVSKFWMSKSFSEIREAPGRWIALLVQKSFMVINRYEVPDVDSLEIHREKSAPLKLSSVWNFGFLFPIGVFGLFASRGRWRDHVLHYVLIAMMIAAVVGFFILGRYRFPLVPLLIPFAAFGLSEIWTHLRQKTLFKQLKLPLVLGVLAAVLANLPVHDEIGLNASSLKNVGIAVGRSGDYDRSIGILYRSMEIEPGFADTHFNLGYAYLQVGQVQKAVQFLSNATQLDPDLPSANLLLGQIFERSGDTKTALQFYQAAALIPSDREQAIAALEKLGR